MVDQTLPDAGRVADKLGEGASRSVAYGRAKSATRYSRPYRQMRRGRASRVHETRYCVYGKIMYT